MIDLSHLLALQLCEASNVAYMEATIESELAHVHITHTDRHVVLAFRGSQNITDSGGRADWLTNLNKKLVPESDGVPGRVHAGFKTSTASLMTRLLMHVEPHLAHRSLLFTGHSKGGAEATRCAAICLQLGLPVAGGCTFASPRVYDDEAAAWLNGRLHWWRYSYQSDWVPRLPRFGGWQWWPPGPRHYAHVGRTWWQDGKRWRNDVGVIRRLGAFVFSRSWPLIGDSAADHGVGRYHQAIRQAISNGELI